MPQLDIYILCNMLFCVLFVFIFVYKLNISNMLIILNIILRVRKIKIQIDKKYSYLLLKEVLINSSLRIYKYILINKNNLFINIYKLFILEDILDISTLKKRIKKLKKK